MQWFVYIIHASDNSFYTGVTTDIERRFAEHKNRSVGGKKGAKFFNGRKPISIVYSEDGHSRSSACSREAEIKKLSRIQKQQLIAAHKTNV